MKGKREISMVLITMVVVASIFAVTSGVIKHTNRMMRDYCFEELERTAADLAAELKYIMDADAATLDAMARIIASQNDIQSPETLDIMKSFSSRTTYIRHVEMLTPDGVLTREDGLTSPAQGFLDFGEEMKKGEYLSGKEISPFNGQLIMRCAAPVVKNGQTVAMLYGVVTLARLVEMYKTDIYDGEAYVYIVDGETGDFLLDTWHKTLGNINDLGTRQVVEGYDLNSFIDDVKNLQSGNLAFISRTIGQVLYMRYAPIGVNKLSVMLTVSEEVALEQMRSISKNLYAMAAFDGAVLLIYLIIVGISMFGAYKRVQRIGFEDQMTLLQNRISYDRYVNASQSRLFESVACVYIDANGLHEINNRFGHDAGDQMLKTVANALKASFPPKCVYRIGGDEFVVLTTDFSIEALEKKIAEVNAYAESHEYTVSTGLSWRENELGVSRVIQEADERMLADKRNYYLTHDRRTV